MSGGGPATEERPPWQWVVIAAAATLLTWLPLAYLARWLVIARVAGGEVASWRVYAGLVSALSLALVLAAGVGGLVVGRFASQAGAREAMLGSALVAAATAALAAPEAGWAAWALATVVVCALAAAGAWVGVRWARRG